MPDKVVLAFLYGEDGARQKLVFVGEKCTTAIKLILSDIAISGANGTFNVHIHT